MTGLVRLLTGLTALAVMGTVAVTDPTGDAAGDGTIVAPTAPRYANSAIFDLQDVNLAPAPDGAGSVLTVTLGAIDVNESTALGFGSVVLDLYLDASAGGGEVTLAGPGMLLPSDRGWDYAVRVTPDGASGYRYSPPASTSGGVGPETDVIAAGSGAGVAPAQVDAEAGAGDGAPLLEVPAVDHERVPVTVSLVGSTLAIATPWTFVDEVTVFALSGVHDPFNPTGWRPLSDTPSPWAYSGGEQVVPVIDLLAPSQDAQVRALRTGVLPLPTVPPRSSGAPWLVLMAVGLVVAAAGLVLRRRVHGVPSGQLRTGLPPEPVVAVPATAAEPVTAAPLAPAHESATVASSTITRASAASTILSAGAYSHTVTDSDTTRATVEETPVDGTPAAGPDGSSDAPPTVTVVETAEPAAPGEVLEHEPVYSGVSAFDSFVLHETDPDDDLEVDAFEKLSDKKAVPGSDEAAGEA